MPVADWALTTGAPLPVGKPERWAPAFEVLWATLSRPALFQGRWEFRQGRRSAAAYAEELARHAEPALARFLTIHRQEGLFFPRCTLAWIPCRREQDALLLYPPLPDRTGPITWAFPRARKEPQLCLADFFPENETTLIPLWAATIGSRVVEVGRDWHAAGRFQEYHLLHGLAAELADGAAVLAWHRAAERAGMMIDGNPRGVRMSFGYPCCPELTYQQDLLPLVAGDRIGITLTENDMMVPEFSVSGFVVFHPEARYFAV